MTSFVFNITNRTLHKKVRSSSGAILCYRYYGPAFGNWFWRIGKFEEALDLRENDSCQSDSHLTNGDEYEKSTYYEFLGSESIYFSIVDYEVYKVSGI